MITGQTDGDSQELTIDSAASAFESLFDTKTQGTDEATTPETESNDEGDEEQSPEVETAETDGDEQDNDAEDTPEETDEATPEPRTLKVKVDGEEIEVTEEEAIKGYSRTADYTRKTQKHAEEVRAFESERVSVREERQRTADLFTQLEEAIASVTPDEPDWDTLRNENPAEFAAEWASWQQFNQRRAAISQQRAEAVTKVQKDQQAARASYLEGEKVALLEAIPEWKDESVASTEKAELTKFALDSGYTDNDLAEVTDHRVVTLLRKAMLYDRSQKAKPSVKVRIEKIKSATPGSTAVSSRQINARAQARQRLANSGSIHDAAALFNMDD